MTNLDHLSTETLADYAEGLLRESDATAVAAHLSACADCRAEELLLASLSEILRADNPGPMPAIYAARIDAALAEVAMTYPISGSFHAEGSVAAGAALDLTPAALASASAQGGGTGPSADVIDLAARRRVVAQGLSRVTTVAASIVLLIGGTVLGLQALNSGDSSSLDSPNELAAQPSAPPVATPQTIQPSPIRNPVVPIFVGATKNSDGSYTNPNGVVVRKDGSAVLPSGKVIKKKPGSTAQNPTAVNGPFVPNPVTQPNVGSKTNNAGPLVAAQGKDEKPAPVITEDPANPAINPAITPEPDSTPAGAEAGSQPTADASAQGATDSAKAAPDTAADSKTAAAPSAQKAPPSRRDTYVADTNTAYNPDNFAQNVLALLDKAGYHASSVGDAQPDAADPAPDGAPAVSPDPAVGQFQESSVDVAMSSPSTVDAPDAADQAAAQGPASPDVKRRVARCATQLGGVAIAGDTGIWTDQPVTIVVMPDPADDRQVIGWAVAGPCNQDHPAKDNVQHQQFVVTKP